MTTETMHFTADVSRLLDIVANALYSNHDVFLRELISNASDACDRLRYEAITRQDLIKADPEFRIRILRDPDAYAVTVLDNGIGMNRDELVEHLGTIARSGTAALMQQMKDKEDGLSLIGQFGVGFYASFTIAKKVSVVSRRAGESQAWHWESDGRTGFTVREASDEEAAILSPGGRGTAVIVHLSEQGAEFLIEDKLREVIRTYSNHINVPVYVGPSREGEQPVNAARALWMRSKSEVTPEEYTAFYQDISHGFDEPLLTAHWRAEGKFEYNALLFVPTMRPWDLYDPSRRHAVRLYVKRVFITDDCEGLIEPWLRFLRGAVDCQDLPLNISREMLQHNPLVSKIRSGIAKKILAELDKLAGSDQAAFLTFWGQFGAVLKEGLYNSAEHRTDLFKICRFASTQGEAVSLSDYIGRMKDGQTAIYYISGEKRETVMNSPQLEGFKARGIEVLFMTDTIDDFWLQMVGSYDGKNFVSITKGAVDLSKFETTQPPKDEKAPERHYDALLAALKETLKDEVSDVRLSQRLTDSPVCLVAGEQDVDMHMEKVLRISQKYEAPVKRILEINGDHSLIVRLMSVAADSGDLKDAALMLLDQARIIEGTPLPDPSAFSRRMARFMERGL